MAMHNVESEIISYIKENRVSTTEVADCLGKAGLVSGLRPVVQGNHCVGRVRYVYAFDESNWSIHEQIRFIEPGEVVFIDGIHVNDRALIGELVTKYILLYQSASAVVIRGNLRDANNIIRMKYGVWCLGFSPVGCFNDRREESEEIQKIVHNEREKFNGAIAVCDDSGVVMIPKQQIDKQMLEKLKKIEEQEDQWFYCIDRLKWNTFDTVCLKKYANPHPNEDYVLVVGGSFAQCNAIRILKELGVKVVVCDADNDCAGGRIADYFEHISTTDTGALIDLNQKYHFSFVVSTQSDSGAVSAASVALALGVPGLSQKEMALFTEKHLMRGFLEKNHFPFPKYRVCCSEDDVRAFLNETGKTIVIKPVASQGSRGVEIISEEKECVKFKNAALYSADGSVIAEEFMKGEEYTVEGMMVGGTHFTLGVSKKHHYDDLPCVSDTLTYSWNEEYDKLSQEHNYLMEKTGLQMAITHSEYIKTEKGYVLVEFAARGGGSMISSHIVPAISGWDVEKIYIYKMLGKKMELPSIAHRCAKLHFFQLEEKKIKSISGVEEIQKMANVLHFSVAYEEGDIVKPVSNDTNRHGFYITEADTECELEDIDEQINKLFAVIYE